MQHSPSAMFPFNMNGGAKLPVTCVSRGILDQSEPFSPYYRSKGATNMVIFTYDNCKCLLLILLDQLAHVFTILVPKSKIKQLMSAEEQFRDA